jgi:hypothetical protein
VIELEDGEVDLSDADPAVRFIATVSREVSIAQNALDYGEFFDTAGLGDPRWSIMELESVASRMTEHMRARSSESPEDSLWEGARDEYLMRIKILKNEG